jgi:valyl-tRNA synthetase
MKKNIILDKRINYEEIEKKWQTKWVDEKIYSSVPDSREKFSLVIPPPNVTGVLHMGHALNNTFQDVIARFKRSQGYNVCWVPGTDHAGIATQVKVKNELEKKGIDIKSLTKEEFLEHIWKWKEESGSTILTQLKKLGCSCDWNRECFTMDEQFSSHVKDIFIKLYNDGLVYQSEYMINWDPVLQSAIADDEVETKSTRSKLYYIKYFNSNDPTKYIVVATSRPETIFGDVAIGFNPEDIRYSDLIDREYEIPLISKSIKLIPDNLVDKDFGSGLVKITPAHDKFDFEFGQRHNFVPIQIINKKMEIINTNTKYDGMHINQARKMIVSELEEQGYIEKIIEYDTVKKVCYRTQAQIEPLITTQWFVNMKPLAQMALELVENKEIELFPQNKNSIFNSWVKDIKPWCISRQLIWGHQIPIFNCPKCLKQKASKKQSEICIECQIQMIQETDVLDTWFSSWLWPFGVFNDTELDYYFPTDILITGSDILFFWVIRMMMASKYYMDKKPFSKVYLHGIVRDETKRKMSKSLGNVIDPINLIEKFGCDPVRFSLLMTTPYDSDIPINEKTFDIGKTFCTKFWNIVRYTQSILIGSNLSEDNIQKYIYNDYKIICDKDQMILDKLVETKKEIESKLEIFEFGKATKILYTWTWDYLANDYLEYIKDKIESRRNILLFLVLETVKMAHPFIPHITSEMKEVLEKFIN